MMMHKKRRGFGALLGATALTLTSAPALFAQDLVDCAVLINGVLPAGCEQPNATTVVTAPTGANTLAGPAAISNDAGFVLAIDGVAIDADPRIVDQVRQTDLALAQADIRVTFDGQEPTPRLNVEIGGPARAYGPGETISLNSELNYPAFVTRAEMRIIDRNATGGPRLLGTFPVDPNGAVQITLPQGSDLVVIHRVYDAQGRYDETEPLPLSRPDDRALRADVEEGADFTATRSIRVNGGTVTVAANQVAPGAMLYTLGESVAPDQNGRLVIQRILPAGEYAVDVEVRGAGPVTALTRDVTIPRSDWFYVGVADLTFAQVTDDATGDTDVRSTARLQYYVDGETESGVQITSSLDTGEEEFGDLFRRLDDKDPRSVLLRLDQLDTYPTFGDDSTAVDNTPTSGKFYLRIERDGNFALWGDYQSTLDGSGYLRNERTLYGAQAYYASEAQTDAGDARVSVEVYAAEPDQLVGRDVFRGTGGSVYFLSRQDLTQGSETLTVELRDAATGRVIERQTLVEGRDYSINYLQGLVTLTAPLSGSANPNLVQTRPGGDVQVNLVAQYEYTPTGGGVDGLSTGGRFEAWVTDDLRFGVTAMNDDTGTADQTAVGVDLRYQFGQNSFVQLDFAETDGPGYGVTTSLDGGLIIDETGAVAGSGQAVKIEAQADLTDLGFGRTGVVGAYYEDRTAGFTTLDYQVDADETLYGVFATVEPDQRMGWTVYADRYESASGEERTEAGAGVSSNLTDRVAVAVGAEYLDEVTTTTDGSRTALAARLTFEPYDGLSYVLFGQTTLQNEGLDAYDRYGVGINRSLSNGWTLGAEISDGTGGIGGRLLATQERSANESVYFGYELDPGRTIDAGISPGDNGGKYVLGGRRQISDDVAMFGENTYDIFDTSRSLTSAYGVEYTRSQFLTYDAAVELAQVQDSVNGDFDRTALSFGVRYDSDDLTARGRIEYRQERADAAASRPDADTVLVSADARYTIDETQRVLLSFSAADTQTDESSLLNGRLVDASIGYAYRPVDNERINILARYRYLYDMYGQEVDGVAGTGPVQVSHVFSVEGNYDINQYLTLGTKLGGRISESAPDGASPLVQNDAWLAVINARYHVVDNWDVLIEARQLNAVDAGTSETSLLGVVYRDVGQYAKVGLGYNFGSFSDDLTDLTNDDQGLFLNIVASF